MLLKGFLYFAILVSAAIASILPDTSNEHQLAVNRDKRIVKRDAAIIIDSFPAEPIYQSDPSVVYRQITRRRYNPNTKYGPPHPKYRSQNRRKPSKKHKKPSSSKYGPPSYKKRPSKLRYGPPKQSYKPVYGPPKKKPTYIYEPVDTWNYGDGPSNYEQAYEKPSFGEPPSDFDAPYHSASNIYKQQYKPDEYETAHFDQEGPYETMTHDNYEPESDYNFANTKERPIYIKPEYYEGYNRDTKDRPAYTNYEEDSNKDVDPKILKYINRQNPALKHEKSRPYRKLSKKQTRRPSTDDEDAEVLVGGQYAEPPARYIAKFQPSDTSYDGTDFSPMQFYMNPDRVSTMSSYVNYKNSNMAFSPQNLNDAFSIVEAQ